MAAPVHNDPLSTIAFAEPQDDMVEEVPIHDDLPPHKAEDAESDNLLAPDAHHLSSNQGQVEDLNRQLDTTRVDHMASYGQLVGQPSYDDSGLFDRPGAAPESETASSSRSSPALKITVTDPLKKAEQNFMGVQGGYVTYRVSTQTSMPTYPRSGSAVRRRFRDFVALGDLLKTTHRGYFIPPRPEKNPVEGQRASADFVEGRRSALQHYLEQLAAHPVISQSEELKAFLTVEGSLADNYQWRQLQPLQSSVLEGIARLPKQLLGQEGAITAPSEAAQSTKHTSDLLRRFKEYATSVKEGMKAEPPPLTDEETTLRNEKIRVDDFQEKLINASRKAEKMVSQFEEMGNVLGDLGLALIAMAKYEDEEGARTGSYTDSSAASKDISADAKRVGMTSVRLSRLARQATAGFATELTPLHDHLALTRAVAKALREREEALLTVHALENELRQKRRGISSLEESGQQVFGGDKGKTRRVHNLQADVAALEAALEAAKAEYDRVLDRNLKEVQRWEKDRAEDFGVMLNQFAGMEVAFHERSRDVWQEVAEQMPAAPSPSHQ
ncbi:g12424 [Coccomyxa viridis]|uniref:G12424 protein n=1 Tax=Coccomyxa viridis TaxID=1274662 RepID=A0ABP1GCW9_9CHLO